MNLEQIDRWLMRRVGTRSPVIDIGCGDGNLAIRLAQRGISVTGVDLDPVQLRLARERATSASVEDRIAWRQADAQALAGLPSGTFAVAVLAFSLHHMEDPIAGLAAAWRVLAPRGRLLVAEMLPLGPDAGDLCHRTALGQWLAWLAALEPGGLRLTVLPRQEWLLAALEQPAQDTLHGGVRRRATLSRPIPLCIGGRVS